MEFLFLLWWASSSGKSSREKELEEENERLRKQALTPLERAKLDLEELREWQQEIRQTDASMQAMWFAASTMGLAWVLYTLFDFLF